VAPRSLHAPEPQPVTFVELFFDLVFVFAVTQTTVALADDLTWAGAVRGLLLFWLIWWAWTQFTWTLNPADTTHRLVRAITLAATATAFVMAASVPRAFADDALWFAGPYVVVRALGLWLQVRVDLERGADDAHVVVRWAWGSTVGLALVVVGALVDPPARNWVWLLVVLADLAAATLAGRGKTWDLHPGHVAERHGLFVIIALGESLIVAGTAVAGDVRTTGLVVAGLASVAVVALMWWTYFDWFKESLEEGLAASGADGLGQATRDAYSLGHFPLVCGIVGVAVAVEEIMVHPDDPAPLTVRVALAAGVLLFLGATVLAHRRLLGEVLVDRAVVGQVGVGVRQACPAAAHHDLGHRLLVEAPGVHARPCLQRGEADGVGPQRRHVVRVELARQHLVQGPGRALAVGVDERAVDLAELELHPGLVERPGAVHLDVALLDGWPRADAIEGRHEAEGLAGEVVGRPRAGEADLGLGQPGLVPDGLEDRHEHLDLVEVGLGPHVRHLGGGDHCDVDHQVTPSPGWVTITSGSPLGRK